MAHIVQHTGGWRKYRTIPVWRLRVVAALTMFAAMPVLGQQLGSSPGAINRSISGAVDRSVHAEVGQSGTGGAKAKTASSHSVWGPSRNGNAVSESVLGLKPSGVQGRSQEATVSGEGTSQRGTMSHQTGEKKSVHGAAGMGKAKAGASSFGLSSESEAKFAFNGKARNINSREHDSAMKAKQQFAKETHSRAGSGVVFKRKKHGGGKSPKTLEEPKGEEGCDQSSKMQLCTWL
jgi:hypothetical protein